MKSSRPPMLPKHRSSPTPTTTLDDMAIISGANVHASTTVSIYSRLSQPSPDRDNISSLLRQGNGHSAASTSITTLSNSPPSSPLPLFVSVEDNSHFEITIEAVELLPLTKANLAEHNARESGCEPFSFYLLRRNFEHAHIKASESSVNPDADYVSQDYQSSLSVSSLL